MTVEDGAQRGDQVGGEQAALPALGRGQVAGGGVQADPRGGGLLQGQALGDEGGDDAGEGIAHAAAGHPWVARAAHPRGPVAGPVDEGPGPLEDRDPAESALESAHGGEAVGLDLGGGAAQQASGLARVGGDDPAGAGLGCRGQQVQGVGVHHQGPVARQDLGVEGPTPVPLAEPRAEGDHVRPRQQGVEPGGVGHRVAHQLGAP